MAQDIQCRLIVHEEHQVLGVPRGTFEAIGIDPKNPPSVNFAVNEDTGEVMIWGGPVRGSGEGNGGGSEESK